MIGLNERRIMNRDLAMAIASATGHGAKPERLRDLVQTTFGNLAGALLVKGELLESFFTCHRDSIRAATLISLDCPQGTVVTIFQRAIFIDSDGLHDSLGERVDFVELLQDMQCQVAMVRKAQAVLQPA